jgi:hypothetical protein
MTGGTVKQDETKMDLPGQNRVYISVGELSVGFSENAIPSTACIAEKKIELFFPLEKQVRMTFIDGETLKWELMDRAHREEFMCPYRAIVPREGFLFIDLVVSLDSSKSVSVVLDTVQKCATVITGTMPTTKEVMIPMIVRAEKGMPLTSVQVVFEHAAMDQPFSATTARHERTTDLVGERIVWVYSSKDIYEHIYLEENIYSWHCIAGNEKGLADTDRCVFYKIAKNLYLFVWMEKIVPTLGVVIEDLDAMRSYGKIFGHTGYDMDGAVSNFPVGSFGKVLNRTEYDPSSSQSGMV